MYSITWHGQAQPEPTVAIGIFDGVHCGHQEILKRARSHGRPVLALTFFPHPTSVFAPERTPSQLLSLATRVTQLRSHGADAVAVIEFTREFAALTPDQFIERVLVNELHARHVVVGANFTFGALAAGNVDYLSHVSSSHGFSVDGVELVSVDHDPVSSTRIRKLVLSGAVEKARKLLTRPHQISGPVIHGEKRGRTIGYPTANVDVFPNATIPTDGVYAGWLNVGALRWPAAISIGTNPTFEGVRARQVEAYALDETDLDLYGLEATIEFGWRLRDTIKFTGLEPLLTQMKMDCDLTRELTAQ